MDFPSLGKEIPGLESCLCRVHVPTGHGGGGGSLLILVQDLDQETRNDGQGLWAPSQRRRNSADC